jgi:predicted ferric reductase
MRISPLSVDRNDYRRELSRTSDGSHTIVAPRRFTSSLTAQTAVVWIVSLVVLGNAAIIVWLWLKGGGISAVHGTGEAFTSVGRITGLLGAYLLLIQILLLARLPFAEQLAGFDKITIWHRRNGKLCLYLILAHVIFITIGYAGMDKISVPREVSTLLSSYPGMVTATVGTVLLVLVVVSSLIIVRQRLRYEAWYVVHFLSYGGIVLAWFHQIPTGNEFAANATAAAYWTALYVGTLGLMVLFRFARPLLRASWYHMRVSEVIEEGPNVVSLRIRGLHLDKLGSRAGQFFLWRFLDRGRWWESHPFSLSAAPDGRSLRITVKSIGDFTSHMGAIRPGTRVVAEGPFGHFTDAARRRDKVALIAGGIGITPIRALAEGMSGDVVLIYRVLREEDIVFREELDRLARDRDMTVHYVVGNHAAPQGERIMSPEHLHELMPDIEDRDIYVCGPPRMADFIEQNVRNAGVPSRYIHIDRFAL